MRGEMDDAIVGERRSPAGSIAPAAQWGASLLTA
jgi:hypothetical protein